MRANRFVTSLVLGALASVTLAQTQAQLASDSLRNRLERAYPLTKMDSDGFKVVEPGIILAVQQDGIQANSLKFKPFANKYEDGKVSPKGLSNVIPGDITQSRTLAVRDKVFLIGMVIAEDGVTMIVQSCGGCDPIAVDPGHKPHWASIRFKFIKGYLTSTDLPHVRKVIESLLAPAYSAPTAKVQTMPEGPQPSVQPQSQAEVPPTLRHYNDIIPPTAPTTTKPTLMRQGESMQQPKPESEAAIKSPPAQESSTPAPATKETEPRPEVKNLPAPAPKIQDEPKAAEVADPEIQTGWSRDRVISVLGTPLKDQKNGGQEILTYPHVTVALEKGRVVAIAKNI